MCKRVLTVTEPVTAIEVEDEAFDRRGRLGRSARQTPTHRKRPASPARGWRTSGEIGLKRPRRRTAAERTARASSPLLSPPTCLAYSGDNRWGAAGIDRDVQVLDMRDRRRARKIDRHDDNVSRRCAFRRTADACFRAMPPAAFSSGTSSRSEPCAGWRGTNERFSRSTSPPMGAMRRARPAATFAPGPWRQGT